MGALKDAKPSTGNRIPDKTRVLVQVVQAEAKLSKSSGNPMIELEFQVVEGEHAEKKWKEWGGTQDTGTFGFRTAQIIRAAGLAHLIEQEVQAPDTEIAAALLGKYLIVDVALEMEKEKDGTQKMYQGTDGNMYPSSRNRGSAFYQHKASGQAPVAQVAQPQPQIAQPQTVQQPIPQQAPPQYAQPPAPQQYVAPQQVQQPQYAPPPAPQQVQQPAPQGYAPPPPPQGAPVPQGAVAPWQLPPQPAQAPKGRAKKQG